jgi:hypothetical protein
MTARVDLRSYGYALLQTFQAANPALIAAVHPKRPSHFNNPKPLGFMDILIESATHTQGTRERVMSPSFVFVFDPTLSVDTSDEVVDTFADFLTDNPHIVPNTIWDRWEVTEDSEEVESEQGTRILPSVRFTLPNWSIREGRSP